MDELDQASDMSQDFVDRAIEANRRPARKLVSRGLCYNCDEPVEGAKLFCDPSCAEDWESRIKRVRNYQVFEGAS